ncbi:MAG: thioredoxin TrxC [Oceanospirillaceae bacterium]|jgi:thioredoxin 2|nr:thioredoxin TrxC [Oceanospirillaceae bacterium]MBT4443408.1 thioredoxin TrxC [Oceanospirillaceae bacterium]MBT7329816.1 thioredoxin TrxC [Oceanospirillaceae bacterium]
MPSITSRCPHCQKNNRVPSQRITDEANCGACKQTLFAGKPIAGTAANFNALVNSDKPVVVDFWAPWCGPCVGFAPVFEHTAQAKSEQMRFVKVDTEAEQMLGSQFNIRSIPTLMVFKNGKVVDQLNGALPQQQFDQWLNAAMVK